MTKEKHHPKRWLSGERAKDFRRRLGASDGGKDSGKHTFTFKFPLAAEQPDEKTRDFLRLQYEKLASIEENSLFHFFAAVHLSGIRLFTNRTDAAAFAEKSVILNSPFNQELCKAYGLDKTAGKALIEFLAKEIRGNNKNEERLLTKLQGIEEFTGAKNDNKQLPSFLKETARLINKDSLWAANQKTKRFEAMCLGGKKLRF